MKVKLEDVCEKGTSNLKQSDVINKTGKYPIYGAAGYIGNVDFYHQDKPYIAVVKDGAGIGRTTMHPANSSVIGTMQYLLPKENVLPKYLYYVVQHMHLEKYFSGATIPHIYFKDYKNEEFKLESLDKQAKIVEILDKVELVIAKRKEELQSLDNLIKSRFIELFGDPICNEKNWPCTELGNIAEIRIGPFGTFLHKEDYITNGHALVNPSHIINGNINVDVKLTVSDAKYNELSAYHLMVGDIVLGRRGEMGRCAVVCQDGLLCGTGSMIIRPNEEMKPYFLQNIISNPAYKKIIEDKAVGVTMMNLNVPIVSSLVIPLFPLELQDEFVAFIKQTDKSKLAVQKSLQELEILKKSLMQQYFG